MYSLELERKVFYLLSLNVAYTARDVALLAEITIPKASLICHHLVAKDKLMLLSQLDNDFQPLYVKVITNW